MSSSIQEEVWALTSKTYLPEPQLQTFLKHMLEAAIHKSNTGIGAICLDQGASPRVTAPEPYVFVDNITEEKPRDLYQELDPSQEASRIGDHALNQGYVDGSNWKQAGMTSTPIVYGEKSIGEILTREGAKGSDKRNQTFFRYFAREMAYHIKRYEVCSQTRDQLGKDLLLVGSSAPMRKIDQFIERSSLVDLPVIISGEFGSEHPQVACAIHFTGPRHKEPFAEVHCRALRSDNFETFMENVKKQVSGGTLFLNGVDELDQSLQRQMLHYLGSNLGQWFGQPGKSPRLIGSTGEDLYQLAEQNKFCRNLLAELDFLKVHLEPLRNRRQDIRGLIKYVMNKYGCASRGFTDNAVNLLMDYKWPENLSELERVVARVSALSGKTQISADDIIDYAPKLSDCKCAISSGSQEMPEENAQQNEEGLAQKLARSLVIDEAVDLKQFHPSLQRAISWLGEHFCEDFSLTNLAEASYVSHSHLSYLFKSELGVSFKAFLAMIRIEKAKSLLIQNPEDRITDIALDAGFGDLSHFEKTFKKIAGCKPTAYRRKSM